MFTKASGVKRLWTDQNRLISNDEAVEQCGPCRQLVLPVQEEPNRTIITKYLTEHFQDKTKLASIILSFSLTLLGASEAATYYVAKTGDNSNPGTQSSPWQTISFAENNARAGDKVIVSAGTYSENVTVNGSGSAGAVITFQGSGNPFIAGNLLISGTYITFDGFTVSPPSVGSYSACDIEGSNNTLSNTVVTNYGATASDQATAISTGGSFNTVDHCSILNLNDIDVFHIWGHDITISNNTVSQVNVTDYAANHTDFVQTWGLQSSQISYNIRIFGNLVENSTCDIGNTETDGNPNLHDWYIYNNIFYNIGSSFFSGLPNTWVFNNLFMLGGDGGAGVSLDFYTDTGGTQSGGGTGTDYNSSGSRVQNNIFIAGAGDIGVGGNSGVMPSVITNNYFASTTAYAPESNPTGTSYVNGGNPEFTNAAGLNFHINAGSVLIGRGANLSSIFKTDKDGKTRAAWDIGPYAYTGSQSEPTPSPTPTPTPTPTPNPTPTPTPPVSKTWSLFSPSDTPAQVTWNDPNSVELGAKFQTSAAGRITAIRFYKGAQNQGTHVANLWTATGTLLATATFTKETASGWQQVSLPSPVTLAPGTTYIVSYHTDGFYSANHNYFNTSLTNGPLTAPDSVSSGGNGVYSYGSGSNFPENTYGSSNYWVDVVFYQLQ